MGKLSDILVNGSGDKLRAAWSDTHAAADFAPLPPATYIARVVSGELFTSRTNATPGYKLAFKVLEGEYAGRQVWLDVWLTEAALPMAKRDLAKLGVVRLEQLEAPLPRGIRSSVRVALRTADDGTKFNVVRSFDVIGIDPPDLDPFAPAASSGSAEETTTKPAENLDAEPATANVEEADTPPTNGTGDIPF